MSEENQKTNTISISITDGRTSEEIAREVIRIIRDSVETPLPKVNEDLSPREKTLINLAKTIKAQVPLELRELAFKAAVQVQFGQMLNW